MKKGKGRIKKVGIFLTGLVTLVAISINVTFNIDVDFDKEGGINIELNKKSKNGVWLEDLKNLSCVSQSGDMGGEISYEEWGNHKDNKGDTYQHGVYVGEVQASLAFEKIAITYYLGKEYSNIRGQIVLSERGKNLTDEAKLKIYFDDNPTPEFVTEKSLSAGFVPEKFDLSIKGVEKISFVLEGVDEWFWGRDFGIVDTQVLK